MHAPCRACPLPCMPLAIYAPCHAPPGTHAPCHARPPCEQNNRRLWKHSLSATTVADGNKCQAWLSALQGQHFERDAEGSGEYADQYMDPTMEDPLDYCEFLFDLISELNVELISLVVFLSFSVLWTWILTNWSKTRFTCKAVFILSTPETLRCYRVTSFSARVT